MNGYTWVGGSETQRGTVVDATASRSPELNSSWGKPRRPISQPRGRSDGPGCLCPKGKHRLRRRGPGGPFHHHHHHHHHPGSSGKSSANAQAPSRGGVRPLQALRHRRGLAMSGCDAARLLDAADFAARKHAAQRRKDPEGTPYINHPIGVAQILAQEAGVTEVAVLQAALLHDTVEDTATTLAEIEARFGEEVRRIVEEVTDDKTLPKAERKRLQVEHAAQSSHAARLVKLADKLYNLRDLTRCAPTGWSEERVQEYFLWASKVVSGLSQTEPVLEEKLWQLLESRGIPRGVAPSLPTLKAEAAGQGT